MPNPFRRRSNPDPSDNTETAGWRARLETSNLREQEFTDLIARLIIDRQPGAQAVVSGPLKLQVTLANGMDAAVDLGNLWEQCGGRPGTRVEQCERFLGALSEVGENTITRDALIVPVIKPAAWVEQVGRKLKPMAQHLVADLWIVYAKDKPNSLEFLTEEYEATLAELRSSAIENLRSALPSLELHGGEGTYLVAAGGNFEASILLLDDFWEQVAHLVEGDLVAVVPSRDVLVFTGSNSADGLSRLAAIVAEISRGGAYLISPARLVRRDGRWEAFAEERHIA
jgi:hypothetical protein